MLRPFTHAFTHAPDSPTSTELALGLPRTPFGRPDHLSLGSVRRLCLLEVGEEVGCIPLVEKLPHLVQWTEESRAAAIASHCSK